MFYEASIEDPAAVKKIFDREKPEVVIHAAAWTDVDGCEEDPEKAYSVNTEGTRNIAEAAREAGSPVIFLSTDFVFNGKKSTPYTEEDTPDPLGIYGKTKGEAEKVLFELLADHVIVRTSWLYGSGGRNFVDTIIMKATDGEHLKVVNDQVGSPTYAKDLAGALKELITSAGLSGRKTFHISNSGWCSWYDLALRALAEAKGTGSAGVEPVTSVELKRPASRPLFSVLDNSRFNEATGHRMRFWQEALAEYIRERYG